MAVSQNAARLPPIFQMRLHGAAIYRVEGGGDAQGSVAALRFGDRPHGAYPRLRRSSNLLLDLQQDLVGTAERLEFSTSHFPFLKYFRFRIPNLKGEVYPVRPH